MGLDSYSEHGRDALVESVVWLKGFQLKVDSHRDKIDEFLRIGEATTTSVFLRGLLL
jgi:hypothetical protein